MSLTQRVSASSVTIAIIFPHTCGFIHLFMLFLSLSGTGSGLMIVLLRVCVCVWGINASSLLHKERHHLLYSDCVHVYACVCVLNQPTTGPHTRSRPLSLCTLPVMPLAVPVPAVNPSTGAGTKIPACSLASCLPGSSERPEAVITAARNTKKERNDTDRD